jgi:uncharacterized membrane protein
VRADSAALSERHTQVLYVLAGACCFLGACGGGNPSGAGSGIEECNVAAPTSCPSPALHYADVQPILQQRCASCHSGNTEQWPLTDYWHVASWFDIIPAEVVNCRMPPADAGVPITNAERMNILTWLHCGFPP